MPFPPQYGLLAFSHVITSPPSVSVGVRERKRPAQGLVDVRIAFHSAMKNAQPPLDGVVLSRAIAYQNSMKDNGSPKGAAMQSETSILKYFADLEDPRIERNRKHPLTNVITIAILGVICGADTWVDIERIRQSQARMVEHVLRPEKWHSVA